MLLFHDFNVFGYNTKRIEMFVCFSCYLSAADIFSQSSFCNCKGSTAEIGLKKLPGLGGETSNQ